MLARTVPTRVLEKRCLVFVFGVRVNSLKVVLSLQDFSLVKKNGKMVSEANLCGSLLVEQLQQMEQKVCFCL